MVQRHGYNLSLLTPARVQDERVARVYRKLDEGDLFQRFDIDHDAGFLETVSSLREGLLAVLGDVGEDDQSLNFLMEYPGEPRVVVYQPGYVSLRENVYLKADFKLVLKILWDLLNIIKYRAGSSLFLQFMDRLNNLPSDEVINEQITFFRGVVQKRLQAFLLDFYLNRIKSVQSGRLSESIVLSHQLNVDFNEILARYAISRERIEGVPTEYDNNPKIVDLNSRRGKPTEGHFSSIHPPEDLREELELIIGRILQVLGVFRSQICEIKDDDRIFLFENTGVYLDSLIEECNSFKLTVEGMRVLNPIRVTKGIRVLIDLVKNGISLPVVYEEDFFEYIFEESKPLVAS